LVQILKMGLDLNSDGESHLIAAAFQEIFG